MAISLYTSRVVLDKLGIENYGLYQVIAGFVVLFSILNNSMVLATQRFLTFEIGRGNSLQVMNTFNMSITAHIGIAVILLFLCETVGLWYVHNQLVIPEGRESAAYIVYQISLLGLVFSIVRSPYNSLIISYEKMSFFAVISILEAVLKLVIVFALTIFVVDKLILYAALLCGIEFLLFIIYWLYCKSNYKTRYRFYIDRPYFKKLISFLGWTVMGGLATMGTQQAGNLIVNSFYGVVVNAAFGVAYQVNGALNQFVNNFQMAFRPQIVKLYSQEKYDEFYLLMNRAAIVSYYLLFLISFPLLTNMDFVLGIWLKEVPTFSAGLCRILIVIGYIDALQAPLWMGITATGNIRAYQIWSSVLFFLNIPLAIACMHLGLSPYWVLIVRLLVIVATSVYRSVLCRHLFAFPLSRYLSQVVVRVAIPTGIMLVIWYCVKRYFEVNSLLGFICLYSFLVVLSMVVIYAIGLSCHDRRLLVDLVKSKLTDNEKH